jgi:hypothetical protein
MADTNPEQPTIIAPTTSRKKRTTAASTINDETPSTPTRRPRKSAPSIENPESDPAASRPSRATRARRTVASKEGELEATQQRSAIKTASAADLAGLEATATRRAVRPRATNNKETLPQQEPEADPNNTTQKRRKPHATTDTTPTAILGQANTKTVRILPVAASDGPTMISLPAIPRFDPTDSRPVLPAIARDLSPEASDAITAHNITVIPGSTKSEATLRSALPLPQEAKHRVHRHVLISLALLLVTLAISFVPLSHALGAPPPQSWFAQASAYKLPTPTPIPAPTYPEHPIVGGAWGFICTALPFARLAQQQMLDAGLSHPWYVSVILAQWGVEQGWSMPTYTGYNFGNVSAIAGYPYVGGINVPGSPGAFAYAYTPLQGVHYYVIYTQYGFYSGVAGAYPRGPVAQAIALAQSPWDAGHYGGGSKLTNAMAAYGLQRFDNPNAHC